jgi:heterodisulfide reductase subunit A
MKELNRIGVFLCWCGANIARSIDVKKVVEEIKNYPGVAHAEDYIYMCSDPGQDVVRDKIKEHNLDGLVIANCSPTLHEKTFRNLAAANGINPYRCEIANVREQCSWPHEHEKELATEKAIKIIKGIIEKIKRNAELQPVPVPLTKKALVIGGGVTGIQAALDIADGGYEVYLVERLPSIGGHMLQLSETFPTLDCPQCIMTPKMTEANQHENIHILTCSEIEEVTGYLGNFNVKVRKKARCVDEVKCTGCSDCEKVCPVQVPDRYNMGLKTRGAIYREFPQAVPNVFQVEKHWGLPPCRATCPAGVNVPGYVALISQGKYKEAIELHKRRNPLPLVCGRVCNHLCEGACNRKEVDTPVAIRDLKRFMADYALDHKLDDELPENKKNGVKVAIIGSGPAGLSAAYYLAKLGYSPTIFEKESKPGGWLQYGIPEYRLPKKLLKKEIENILSLGVELKTNTKVGKDIKFNDLKRKGYKAIFIGTGAWDNMKLNIPGEDLKGVLTATEFLHKINSNQKVSLGKRVAVVGGGNAAVDAVRTARRLGSEAFIVYRRSRQEMPALEEELVEAEEEGVVINYLTTPVKLIGKSGRVTEMECIKMKLGEPDASGRRRPEPIKDSEYRIKVDSVIPAIGQRPIVDYLSKEKGINFTRWNTIEVDMDTQSTGVKGIFAGGDAVLGPATVVEAISHGRRSALAIDKYLLGVDKDPSTPDLVRQIYEEFLPDRPSITYNDLALEKTPEKVDRNEMGQIPLKKRIGSFQEIFTTYDEAAAIAEANRCLNCGPCTECMECVKACKPEAIDHSQTDQIMEVDVGAIIVATGFDLYNKEALKEYGYGDFKDVLDGLQFERLLAASGPTEGKVLRPSDGKEAKQIVFIQCCGSRDPEQGMPYCSKVCCMYVAKQALLYKHAQPEGQAFVFYIDIRTAGKGYEEFTQRVMEEEEVIYLRGKVSKVYRDGDKIVVMGVDTLTGKQVEIDADMVVLATAVVPSAGVKELASKLRISTDEHGFIKEAHLKLRPAETLTSGIYLGGMAQSPKDITDSVSQGSAAASKVLSLFSNEELLHDPTVAVVDMDVCSGCGICEEICEYQAVKVDPKTKKAEVNELVCEGCGACAATCPSGAIQHTNYRRRQIFDMIDVACEEYG